MNVNRRLILASPLALLVAPHTFAADNQSVSPCCELMPYAEGADIPTLEELENIRKGAIADAQMASTLGHDVPGENEIAIAREILAKSPDNTDPINVAKYFLGLGTGEHKRYIHEWGNTYNPVINAFYSATGNKGEGDCTAWCAAFMNWCLKRAQTNRPGNLPPIPITGSAASSSFRTWGVATDNPRAGDIAVFVNPAKPSAGHVAFLVEKGATYNRVLGGNQGGNLAKSEVASSTCADRSGLGGEISSRAIGINYQPLTLHSFRTHPSLHMA